MTNPDPVVHYPASLAQSETVGPLIGFAHPATGHFNVLGLAAELPPARRVGTSVLGELTAADASVAPAELGDEVTRRRALRARLLAQEPLPEPPSLTPETRLRGVRTDGRIAFFAGDRPCQAIPFSLHDELFSRNVGILESSVLLTAKAVIAGCGSVGSLVALELARAGVGHFLLIDPDILAYHNLCRHQCGIAEVGAFKVDAVKARILAINPEAHVETLSDLIERLPLTAAEGWSGSGAVLVGCADNRAGDRYANQLASQFGAAFVSIGLWHRAFAGEIFYCRPGHHVCYDCLFGGEVVSGRTTAHHHHYLTDPVPETAGFEPGISADIAFVSVIAVKVILDLLQLDRPDYLPRVLDHLTPYTWIANSPRAAHAGAQAELAELFAHPLQITHSIQPAYQAPCPPCRVRAAFTTS